MDITITPHKLSGPVTPPPSKSQAHRALIASGLARGGRVDNLADSQDIRATRRCLEALLTRPGADLPLLDCGESGSTLRFLIPVALALRGGARLTGGGRLLERPLGPYVSAFKNQGIFLGPDPETPQFLRAEGTLQAGRFEFPGDVSSQFITGMLYALPLLEGDSEIVLTSPLESKGYVDMTLDVLERFGVRVQPTGDGYVVPGGQTYRPCDFTVEADWSQAGFWYAANGLGNSVKILGMDTGSKQGDKVMAPYYVKLCGPGEVVLDVSQCPDLVPALAVQAALRKGEITYIVNAARLRIKESDRLDTVTTELCKLGARVAQTPDSLAIQGVEGLTGGTVEAHNDHRIAMMLAVAATRASGDMTIRGAESVNKSYPNFWEDYKSLGGTIR